MGPAFERGPCSFSLLSEEMVPITPENFRKRYTHWLDVQLSEFGCRCSRASPICSGFLSCQGSRAGDPKAQSNEECNRKLEGIPWNLNSSVPSSKDFWIYNTPLNTFLSDFKFLINVYIFLKRKKVKLLKRCRCWSFKMCQWKFVH